MNFNKDITNPVAIQEEKNKTTRMEILYKIKEIIFKYKTESLKYNDRIAVVGVVSGLGILSGFFCWWIVIYYSTGLLSKRLDTSITEQYIKNGYSQTLVIINDTTFEKTWTKSDQIVKDTRLIPLKAEEEK